MANKGATHTVGATVSGVVSGTYIAYNAAGDEIWRKEDFVIGKDEVPRGLSIGMKAMTIVNPKSGEILKRWNPWHVI
jgi:hypothetical protein